MNRSEKWGKNIQATAYNGARVVTNFPQITQPIFQAGIQMAVYHTCIKRLLKFLKTLINN